ncbi:hypothetical protein JDV02_000621 [Purpureocillium takamizusanense]|uniref:Uncharacterized protein n=1 Tax=Purpureocillium takamizusanense TaxID=2060973 RepID=A0A9Q8Q706_9HYPO|nr:uncharacterized protein JDV02_000621 [Purpureocillium takamizusanense]UNI13932.1 hypothetical protein JDV02_000621 [Purpureocillium takamizusanense]
MSNPMFRLDGKVALVIGLGQSGSSPSSSSSSSDGEGWGIGAACAVSLARQGATIFGGNRTLASARRTVEAVEAVSSSGRACVVVETDATSSASVKALVDACLARHGRIDILVANVGQSQPGTAATMAEEVWEAQMQVNLTSAYLALHHALPVMEQAQRTGRDSGDSKGSGGGGGGSIICVSSIAGLRHIGKDQIAYNTAKAALLQLVRATAVSYAGRGVRVNAVVPGLMDTPYTRALADRFAAVKEEGGSYEAFCRTRDAQVPMGRMGDAWDVACAVVFLASDEARYVTGQKIVVDGGITCSTGRT